MDVDISDTSAKHGMPIDELKDFRIGGNDSGGKAR
jgi:hypothetical protein